ncbi:uncharacterized protein B0T23DRAFT_441418 [Neurospora hispaniola]|uniref:D-isomer specific 2-hydroxyacid dehydrogenase NAD-binding domain-containing protein n=1 Tax=Neurospora hispaniola TaxID=588809 RepID=A0AAJ0MQX8_9PEZI|nr:hypothetical protein B0T23DRAFT_441418 [Neurospora hispaniola]
MGSTNTTAPTGGGAEGINNFDVFKNDILMLHVPLPPDQAWIDRLENKYPGFKVRWVHRSWQDYGKDDESTAAEGYEGVTMLCSFYPHKAELLPKLKWVQLTSAGADPWLQHPLYLNKEIVFCTANGCHPPQIAEWVIGTYLMLSHHFLPYHDAAAQHGQSQVLRHLTTVDSPGMRMGILGYGAIGRQVARVAQALGMEIYAYTRRPKPTPESRKDDSYHVPGTGDPDGIIPSKWFSGSSREDIDHFLAQDLDILVVSLPLTASTKQIIGRKQFDILAKKKTFLSNIARGGHVDTEALVEALKEDKIRGAALDVTDPEPLPQGHELLKMPDKCFVTPHVSWQTPFYFERVKAILEENLERWRVNGGPRGLVNLMDRESGY